MTSAWMIGYHQVVELKIRLFEVCSSFSALEYVIFLVAKHFRDCESNNAKCIFGHLRTSPLFGGFSAPKFGPDFCSSATGPTSQKLSGLHSEKFVVVDFCYHFFMFTPWQTSGSYPNLLQYPVSLAGPAAIQRVGGKGIGVVRWMIQESDTSTSNDFSHRNHKKWIYKTTAANKYVYSTDLWWSLTIKKPSPAWKTLWSTIPFRWGWDGAHLAVFGGRDFRDWGLRNSEEQGGGLAVTPMFLVT